MVTEAKAIVRAGAANAKLTERRVAFMRYNGQGHEIETELPPRALKVSDIEYLQTAFEDEYSRQCSRTVPGMMIEVLNWGVSISSPAQALTHPPKVTAKTVATPSATRNVMCDVSGSKCAAGVFERVDLVVGDMLHGPALIVEPQTTTFVSADFNAEMVGSGNNWMTRDKELET